MKTNWKAKQPYIMHNSAISFVFGSFWLSYQVLVPMFLHFIQAKIPPWSQEEEIQS